MIGRSKDDWMIGFCCAIGSATVTVAVTHQGGGDGGYCWVVMVATAAAGFSLWVLRCWVVLRGTSFGDPSELEYED
jgi:hypothetical protein